MHNIQIIGVKYTKSNTFGDFKWMCKQEQYKDSLFIFNDNEECHDNCYRGGGNAIMRQYNKYSDLEIPISAGIPTGTLKKGGYTELTEYVKEQIDNAVIEIEELIQKYNYKVLYYSSEPNGLLGTGIFNVNESVLKYITHKIFNISKYPVIIRYSLPNNFFDNYEEETEETEEKEN